MANETTHTQPDYVVIGHVTQDLVPGGYRVGGTATFAARTALALGRRVGVVTSLPPGFDLRGALDGVQVVALPASAPTVFENRYTEYGRVQTLHTRADSLTVSAVPLAWCRAPIVHLGPVAAECTVILASACTGSFLGITPQGWMRRWDSSGHVCPGPWTDAQWYLPLASAVVLSEEDVRGDLALAERYAAQTAILVLTRGAAGCRVYAGGEVRDFSAPAVPETDPTGAGDVFAATFFVHLQAYGDPWQAAQVANCLAARSVARRGLDGTPHPAEVRECLGQWANGG